MSPSSSSTAGLGPRCLVSQDMSPSGPAMKPSSDIVAEYSSFPMGDLHCAASWSGCQLPGAAEGVEGVHGLGQPPALELAVLVDVLGAQIGGEAWAKAQTYFNGTAATP